MKKTIFTILFATVMILGYSQDSTKVKKTPNQTFYASVGESVSAVQDLTTGIQVGSWGINDNPICYAWTLDYSYNVKYKTNSVYVGFAPSYYFLNLKKSGMFAYVSPKFQIYNSDSELNKKFVYLFEYGLGGYYSVNPHLILQYGMCIQSISTEFNGGKPFIPSLSISINYIK